MSAATQQFNLLLFENFSNHCLANMVEPLRAANTLARQHLYSWQFFTLDGAAVHSSSGLMVTPHGALGTERGDMLVVMPSYGFLDLDRWDTTRRLRSAAGRHKSLAGLDTGSWLLARTGLLDGHRATIHWEELARFEEAFPEVDAVRERFVMDGTRITCSGAMATFDLVSALISRDHGPLLAMEVAQFLMTESYSHGPARPLRAESSTVNRALKVMQAHLETPLSIGDIARRIGCSQKILETRVQAEMLTTPQALYRRLRLNLARKLAAETDQSVAEIASRCGYDNASAMTRAFRAEFGETPRDVRRQS